jgi:hypothetical protein
LPPGLIISCGISAFGQGGELSRVVADDLREPVPADPVGVRCDDAIGPARSIQRDPGCTRCDGSVVGAGTATDVDATARDHNSDCDGNRVRASRHER